MSKIKDTANAVEGIVKAVPIYEDLLQPAMKELGKGVHTLSKTVHIALSPISALVWGYDKIKDFIQQSLEDKLKKIPRENIIPPAPEVAVPAIEALRYTGYRVELRDMFSNLLATAMDKQAFEIAHPSFVEIIKQINPDEAKILRLFTDNISKPIIKVRAVNKSDNHYATPLKNFTLLPYQVNCAHPELGPSYVENIQRLGLVEISYDTYHTTPNAYVPLESHPLVESMKIIIKDNQKPVIKQGTIQRTSFGEKFYRACIGIN